MGHVLNMDKQKGKKLIMVEAIHLQEISKSYPGVQALKRLDFKVEQGRVHGFLGPNGAGKSTTLKIISGLIRPTSGKVRIFGQDLLRHSDFASANIGILPERPPLYGDMVVWDYLVFAANIHRVPSRDVARHVREVVEKTGLVGWERRLIGNLSKGLQQRVGLAQAMVFRPKILILDEPTSGLDPASIIELRQLINSLKGEHTILFSAHQLHEVTQCCSDITILHKGEIVVSDSLEKIQQMFNRRQVVVAEVMRFNEGQRKKIRSLPFIEDLKVEETSEKTYRLTFDINEQEDQRAAIGQFLVEEGHQLVHLAKQVLPLEEIFLHLTH